MKICDLRLVGIRCFDDTGDIPFDPKCNIFVGKNNAGKSSLLKAIFGLQLSPFDHTDVRPDHQNSSYVTLRLDDVISSDAMRFGKPVDQGSMRVHNVYAGGQQAYSDAPPLPVNPGQTLFYPTRPQHVIVPFLAKRKAVQFSQDISLNQQSNLDGTLSTLYNRP